MKRVLCAAVSGLFVLAVVSACGGSDGESVGDGSTSSSSSSGGGSSSGAASSSGTTGSSGTSGTSGEPDASCTPKTTAAEAAPLDLHLLLDASGTMVGPAGGSTKWTAAKTAVKEFIGDAKNAGVGVGLQIFPIVHAGAPASCTMDSDCAGGFGYCIKKACDTFAYGSFLPCETGADCPDNAACGAVLTCNASSCIQNGTSSIGCSAQCNTTGTPLASSTCSAKECFLDDYDDARVPIAALPASATALTTNIDAIPTPTNTSLTPTSSVLAGGLAYATQHAAANPDHSVALVLLTDGAANRCPPYTGAGMSSFVAAARNGVTKVRTFVIGLFANDPTAKTTFDAVASAGGTTAPAIVAPSSTSVADLRAALDAVRSEGACVLKAPATDQSTATLRVADGSGTVVTRLNAAAGAGGCGPGGGWYYDVDPAGGTARKIFLCPTTCAAVKGGTKLETVIACQ